MWYKRTIPLIIVFVVGVLAFVHNYIPLTVSDEFRETITTWIRIIGGFALFIGAYSLLHMHVTRIRRQQPGWGYSMFVFMGASGMIAVGLWNDGFGPLEAAPYSETWFQWAFMNIQVPCSATIFSILAFFMASAAFRTFRARNIGAALLLVAAIVVMLGRVPILETVGSWFGDPPPFTESIDVALSKASAAIMEYPNLAATRGILLGISLGAISQSLRILFGIERSYMGGGD